MGGIVRENSDLEKLQGISGLVAEYLPRQEGSNWPVRKTGE
jgi:hypothetical protein